MSRLPLVATYSKHWHSVHTAEHQTTRPTQIKYSQILQNTAEAFTLSLKITVHKENMKLNYLKFHILV